MTGFRKGVSIFMERRPSFRDLLASRSGTFDRTHAILPSDAIVGEAVTATVQAWDEYERLHRPFDGTLAVSVTDPVASAPDDVTVEETIVDHAPVAGTRWDDERGSDADVYYLRVRQADGGGARAGPA